MSMDESRVRPLAPAGATVLGAAVDAVSCTRELLVIVPTIEHDSVSADEELACTFLLFVEAA